MLDEKNMGKRAMTQGCRYRHSQRPLNSETQVGFFIMTTLEPSSRMTVLTLTRARVKTAPTTIRTMKPT